MENVAYREEKKVIEEVAGGSMVEGIGGAGALILSILGLIGAAPMMLASIAAIGIGGALLVEGGTVGARYSRFLAGTHYDYTNQIIGGGMAMECLGGIAGLVLGILSLLGITPMSLLPVAMIVFGGALLMASGAMSRLNSLPVRGMIEPERAHQMAREAVYVASGSEVLVGAAAVVLGILALSGYHPLVLTLVALLCVGASVMLSGTSIAARMFGIFAH